MTTGCLPVSSSEQVLPLEELLAMLEERGLSVEVTPEGVPVMVGATRKITPELMRQVRLNREGLMGRAFRQYERDRHLVRLPGSNWVRVQDLVPCGSCGGRMFWRSAERLACKKCLPPGKNDKVIGAVDMVFLRQELDRDGAGVAA